MIFLTFAELHFSNQINFLWVCVHRQIQPRPGDQLPGGDQYGETNQILTVRKRYQTSTRLLLNEVFFAKFLF